MIFKLVLILQTSFQASIPLLFGILVHAIKPLIVILFTCSTTPFFTPNEDSINDLWTIKNLDLFPQATITIFNRELLKEMSPTSMGWNGTFNGSKLPAADYWFNLTFEDGKIIKAIFR
jgi:gliding motility-associated-like protein